MAEEVTLKDLAAPLDYRINGLSEVRSAGQAARALALRLGFAPEEAEEIALVALELGSNLLKHAGSGQLHLQPLQAQDSRGIELVSEDKGPGIKDVEQAIADGYSTAGSLGFGLGTVNRLMDRLEFFPKPDSGLRIVCERWVRPRPAERRNLEFGAATRPYRFLAQNGDSLIVRQWADHALAGVIDGLGHGQLAQRAAQAARQYVEAHFHQPLPELFRGTGRACRATRGVVMALARFEFAKKKLLVASVGNIEVRLMGGHSPFRPLVRRGVVGQITAPDAVPVEHPWSDSSLLLMYSDGVQPEWASEKLAHLLQAPAALTARRLLERYGRLDDDATVLVIRPARPPSPSLAFPT